MHKTDLTLRGIAHDINGIMARASLAAEQLREHDDAIVRARAEQIAVAVDRVVDICRDQLAQQLQVSDKKLLGQNCLQALLNQVADMAVLEAVASGQKVGFRMAVAPNTAVSCHPASLFRILLNLAFNGVTAMTAHGGSRLDISVTRAFGRVYFDIADDGPGLPDHVLAYLYPRADGQVVREGHIGTGLITAVTLAKSMDGELRLIKSDQSGTTFCLCLPQTSIDPQQAAVHQQVFQRRTPSMSQGRVVERATN